MPGLQRTGSASHRAPAPASAPKRPRPQTIAVAATRPPRPREGCACGGGCPRCAPRGGGQPLPTALRERLEQPLGQTLHAVRLHTDAQAAAQAGELGAQAFTVGPHIAFGTGRYQPGTTAGAELLAHELAHAVQQSARLPGARAPAGTGHEAQADAAAGAALRGDPAPRLHPVQPGVQRRIEMRDVGRGMARGMPRLQELVDRLNALSPGLLFSLAADNALLAEPVAGATLTAWDQQMLDLIRSETVIPLRLTNSTGLLGTRATGFRGGVMADFYDEGLVDIDDLLASSDAGLQFVLVHFLTERIRTANYARRIGSPSLTGPASDPEFARSHAAGIAAEAVFLRGYFGDPSIRFVFEPGAGSIFRVFRNNRGDRIRARQTSSRGVDAITIEVRLADGRVLSAEEYRALLETERTRAQIERERLNGAIEHREGGRGVPAP
jgi:Domain of unknown function (DUF4157)